MTSQSGARIQLPTRYLLPSAHQVAKDPAAHLLVVLLDQVEG